MSSSQAVYGYIKHLIEDDMIDKTINFLKEEIKKINEAIDNIDLSQITNYFDKNNLIQIIKKRCWN